MIEQENYATLYLWLNFSRICTVSFFVEKTSILLVISRLYDDYPRYISLPVRIHRSCLEEQVLLLSLLDKVMLHNQWHIGVCQHHLMFKGHWRAPYETIYGHKKKVSLDKTFPLGHFMLHFIMFLIRQMTTKASNDHELKYVLWVKVRIQGAHLHVDSRVSIQF